MHDLLKKGDKYLDAKEAKRLQKTFEKDGS